MSARQQDEYMEQAEKVMGEEGADKLPPVRLDPEQLEHAGFHKRLLATLLDNIILLPLMYPLFVMLSRVLPIGEYRETIMRELPRGATPAELKALIDHHELWNALIIDQTLPLVVLLVVVFFCWKYKATTPGKYLMRMIIVDASTGEMPSSGQWVRRMIGYIVSALPVGAGFFWIGIDRRRQAWHDKIANTLVVIDPRRRTLWQLFRYYVLKRREEPSSAPDEPENI